MFLSQYLIFKQEEVAISQSNGGGGPAPSMTQLIEPSSGRTSFH